MKRTEILESANKCVCGGRDQNYGKPENNFTLIAKLWEDYKGVYFSPKDVAVMMLLLKCARAKNSDNIDNYIDICGYAACAGEIDSEMINHEK